MAEMIAPITPPPKPVCVPDLSKSQCGCKAPDWHYGQVELMSALMSGLVSTLHAAEYARRHKGQSLEMTVLGRTCGICHKTFLALVPKELMRRQPPADQGPKLKLIEGGTK